MNSLNNKEWFTAFELAGLGGLPSQATNVTRRATKNDWKKRQVEGKKGVAFEYHYSSLPESVQRALGFNQQPAQVNPPPTYNTKTTKDRDEVVVSKQRFITAISTLDEILEITHKTMRPEAKAQMVFMIYELLSEESANEKIIEMIKLVA